MAADPLILVSAAGVGLLMSAPVGPVSLLSISRALAGAPAAAFATGLGLVVCDLIVATAALTGLRAVSAQFAAYSGWLLLACGVILIATGGAGLRANRGGGARADRKPAKQALTLAAMALQGFVITLGNPLNAAAVATITAGFATVGQPTSVPAIVAALGLGCVAWWAGLAVLAYRLRRRLGARFVSTLNMVVALLLGIAGLTALGFGAADLLGRG